MKLSEYFRLHPEAWVKTGGEMSKCACLLTARTFLPVTMKDRYIQNLHGSIKRLFPVRYAEVEAVFAFNDHPETTLADVIKVLEDAGE